MIESFTRPYPIHVRNRMATTLSLIGQSVDANGIRSPKNAGQPTDAAMALATQERYILARQRAIEVSAAGGETSTKYTYKMGPDGRRYIVGAEVTVFGSRELVESVTGGGAIVEGKSSSLKPNTDDAKNNKAKERDEATAELQRIEREVIAHEAAHKAAAGRFGGPVGYTYTMGPDGRRYVTGGHVPIHTPATSDPEEALRNAETVMCAALAPGAPSGQDLSIMAKAARDVASAKARIAASSSRKGEDGKTALLSYAPYASPEGLLNERTTRPVSASSFGVPEPRLDAIA